MTIQSSFSPNIHATYSAGSDGENNALVDESLGLQPNSYFHAHYHAGSVSESISLHSMQPKGYFHNTYFAGSDSESDSLVDKSLGMQPNTEVPFTDTSTKISSLDLAVQVYTFLLHLPPPIIRRIM